MQQYFIKNSVRVFERICLCEEQAHHIANVMRMKKGEKIRIVDANQELFMAHVQFEGKQVYAYIDEKIVDKSSSKIDIVLAQGLLKKEKWDFLLQKSAELGVNEIIPFISSRSVVKNKEERQDKKLVRWNKILLEACEQSKRTSLVKLHEPCHIKQLKEIDADVKLVAYEEADVISQRMVDVLRKHQRAKRIVVAIGCEGGFSLEEVEMLEQYGFIRVSLGNRILRAETAAISSIANLSFYYDMMKEEDE